MPNVIAIDPGLATGLAWVIDGEFGSVQVPYEKTGPALDRFLKRYPNAKVVCEAFFITRETAKKSQAPWSLKLIGVADYLCDLYGVDPVILQTPADAKKFASDARLKALGWYSGGAGHADDAARHLMLYLAKTKSPHLDLRKIVDT